MWREIIAVLLMMGIAGGQTHPATSADTAEVPLLQDSDWQPQPVSLIQTSLKDLIRRTPRARPGDTGFAESGPAAQQTAQRPRRTSGDFHR